MLNKIIGLMSLAIFFISLSGCATMTKKKDTEIQNLKTQVAALEGQMQEKDTEINSLKENLAKTNQENELLVKKLSYRATAGKAKFFYKIKSVQAALKNAGYDPGSVDGKIGKQTKEAIAAFQKANNIETSCGMNKETWELLKPYLKKKINVTPSVATQATPELK